MTLQAQTGGRLVPYLQPRQHAPHSRPHPFASPSSVEAAREPPLWDTNRTRKPRARLARSPPGGRDPAAVASSASHSLATPLDVAASSSSLEITTTSCATPNASAPLATSAATCPADRAAPCGPLCSSPAAAPPADGLATGGRRTRPPRRPACPSPALTLGNR
jgi:hypothetical protein